MQAPAEAVAHRVDAPADAVAGFEDLHGDSTPLQRLGRHEAVGPAPAMMTRAAVVASLMRTGVATHVPVRGGDGYNPGHAD